MKKEKSCGAIIFQWKKDELQFLVLKMQLGHSSFPKGHVEKDETEKETALREIKEETNLEVFIDTNFRKVITYSPFIGILKDVVFFVALYEKGEIIVQKEEVSEAFWLNEKETLNVLTHESDKECFKEALLYIKQHYQKGVKYHVFSN